MIVIFSCSSLFAANQTSTESPIFHPTLPFYIKVEQTNLQMSVGLQSFSVGLYGNKWLFIGGRINGLHGFNSTGNFPANKQNTNLIVFDLDTNVTHVRAMSDASSGLTQAQIDDLSATNHQYYQKGDTIKKFAFR